MMIIFKIRVTNNAIFIKVITGLIYVFNRVLNWILMIFTRRIAIQIEAIYCNE